MMSICKIPLLFFVVFVTFTISDLFAPTSYGANQEYSVAIRFEQIFTRGPVSPVLAPYRQIANDLIRIINKRQQLEVELGRGGDYNRHQQIKGQIRRLKVLENTKRNEIPPQFRRPTIANLYGHAAQCFEYDKAISNLATTPGEIGKTFHLWTVNCKWIGGTGPPAAGTFDEYGKYDDCNCTQAVPAPPPPPPPSPPPPRGRSWLLPTCRCTDSAGKGFVPVLGQSCASAQSLSMRNYNCQ